MRNIFEILASTSFLLATIVWLVQLVKRKQNFCKIDKLYSITFTLAFILGFINFAINNKMFIAVIYLLGYVVSQFSVAIAFYDNYKDLEITNE